MQKKHFFSNQFAMKLRLKYLEATGVKSE